MYHERRQALGQAYKEGLPDLWCTVNGLHIEIEIKQVGGSVRSRQEKWERHFKSIGVIYLRPDCEQEIKDFFEKELFRIIPPGDLKK